MRYGKIRIEDGFFVFTRHMMLNSLPCKDILWAYMRREGADKTSEKQLIINYLVIITRRQKRYKFDMTEQEVQDCLRLLKVLNPDLAVGFPKGSRLPLQNLPNTRDLGALMTEDGLHILPRKLLRSGEIYHASVADTRILSEEYNVKTVIDFRSAAEVKKKPDDIMAGVEYYHIPGCTASRKKWSRCFSQYYGRRQDRSRDGTFALRTGSAKGNNTKGLHAVESMS